MHEQAACVNLLQHTVLMLPPSPPSPPPRPPPDKTLNSLGDILAGDSPWRVYANAFAAIPEVSPGYQVGLPPTP
jgi:hypothetical protein